MATSAVVIVAGVASTNAGGGDAGTTTTLAGGQVAGSATTSRGVVSTTAVGNHDKYRGGGGWGRRVGWDSKENRHQVRLTTTRQIRLA